MTFLLSFRYAKRSNEMDVDRYAQGCGLRSSFFDRLTGSVVLLRIDNLALHLEDDSVVRGNLGAEGGLFESQVPAIRLVERPSFSEMK